MTVRVGLALLALVVLAWLGLNLRGLVLWERGERLATTPNPTPSQVAEARRALGDARFLNPDTRPLLMEGAMLAARGGARAREGVALVERAVRREPDNVIAWGILAAATRELDRDRSEAARARVRELSPPIDPE